HRAEVAGIPTVRRGAVEHVVTGIQRQPGFRKASVTVTAADALEGMQDCVIAAVQTDSEDGAQVRSAAEVGRAIEGVVVKEKPAGGKCAIVAACKAVNHAGAAGEAVKFGDSAVTDVVHVYRGVEIAIRRRNAGVRIISVVARERAAGARTAIRADENKRSDIGSSPFERGGLQHASSYISKGRNWCVPVRGASEGVELLIHARTGQVSVNCATVGSAPVLHCTVEIAVEGPSKRRAKGTLTITSAGERMENP